MKTLRIVVLSDASPHLLQRLAERIENELSGVKICGLVNQLASSGKGTRPIGGHLRTMTTRVEDLFLSIAGPSAKNCSACVGLQRRGCDLVQGRELIEP